MKTKRFEIKGIFSKQPVPFFKHPWWKTLWMRFKGMRPNRLYTYYLTVEVDSLRSILKYDTFIGQNNTAWTVRGLQIVNDAPAPKYFIDIVSYKPYNHCDIIGPAIVIASKNGWSIDPSLTAKA